MSTEQGEEKIGKVGRPSIDIDENILLELYSTERWTEAEVAEFFKCEDNVISRRLEQMEERLGIKIRRDKNDPIYKRKRRNKQ